MNFVILWISLVSFLAFFLGAENGIWSFKVGAENFCIETNNAILKKFIIFKNNSRRPAWVFRLQKIPTTNRSNMQAVQSVLDRIQRRKLNWHGHLIRMDVVVDWRRFTSGHRTVGGEEDDRNNNRRTKWRTSWEAWTWKKIRQKIDIFGVWEWIDDS